MAISGQQQSCDNIWQMRFFALLKMAVRYFGLQTRVLRPSLHRREKYEPRPRGLSRPLETGRSRAAVAWRHFRRSKAAVLPALALCSVYYCSHSRSDDQALKASEKLSATPLLMLNLEDQ